MDHQKQENVWKALSEKGKIAFNGMTTSNSLAIIEAKKLESHH